MAPCIAEPRQQLLTQPGLEPVTSRLRVRGRTESASKEYRRL